MAAMKQRPQKKSIMPIVILVIGASLIFSFFMNRDTSVAWSVNEFETQLTGAFESPDDEHEFGNVNFEKDTNTTLITGIMFDADGEEVNFSVRISNEHYNTFWSDVSLNLREGTDEVAGGNLTVSNPTTSSFWGFILSLLPTVLIIGVLFFFMSKSGPGKSMDFGKNKAKLQQGSTVRFNDIAGAKEEKEELAEMVDFLKGPLRYTEAGARVPKGVLLVGPPGTGKTLLAKGVAGEAGVPFYTISGSDFVEMFVGVGASRVRNMFKEAKMNAPCIVFIDEIDAVGRQRGAGMGGGNDEREQTLNQLLVEMDGFSENQGIIVIAATNRADVLDPALQRPGRFDRKITVHLPDVKARAEILEVHARNKKFDANVDFKNIAKRTPGFSGAQLENVLNEAALLSVRHQKKIIGTADIDESIDRVMAGPAKKSKVVSEREKKLIAYHEAGHAVIGLRLADAEIVQKVTIIPRGDAGGYVLMTPKEETMLQTKSQLLHKITTYMAGRASEEIHFGKDNITTGAYSDIESATMIARRMVTEFGMSDLGPIKYESAQGSVFLGRDYNNNKKNFSGNVANKIDEEVKKFVENAFEQAKEIIIENKDKLKLIADLLIEHETLTAEEIEHIDKHGCMPTFEKAEDKNDDIPFESDFPKHGEEISDPEEVAEINEENGSVENIEDTTIIHEIEYEEEE